MRCNSASPPGLAAVSACAAHQAGLRALGFGALSPWSTQKDAVVAEPMHTHRVTLLAEHACLGLSVSMRVAWGTRERTRTSLNQDLVQVVPEHNDTAGCSTSARVLAVGDFRGRRYAHVIARELGKSPLRSQRCGPNHSHLSHSEVGTRQLPFGELT